MFRMSDEVKARREALREAYQRLDSLPVGDEETPEFLSANAAVGDAHDRLGWRHSLDIDMTRGATAGQRDVSDDTDGM